MGLWQLLKIGKKEEVAKRSANPFDERFWAGVSTASRAGVQVTPATATQVAAVNAAVRLLAETISSLPLILYRRLPDGGKERATDHPLYYILDKAPNSWQTRFEWIELMVRHLLLRGNGYSQIIQKAGRVVSLEPLHPDQMTVSWSKDGQRVIYMYKAGGKPFQIRTDEILHFRSFSDNGLIGKSPIDEARDVVGNALALDQYQSYFYANGVRASGVLEHPGELTDETAKRIAESFAAAYGGAANSGKVIVLEEGMKLNAVSISPKDAEFLAVRKFSIAEIARIFRVPPHMIGDLDNATFSNIEHEGISFEVHSIRPLTVRIEQAIDRVLLGDEQEYFCEFLLDGLLRGDITARYAAHQIGLNTGFLKINEARAKENLNPLPWGDVCIIPLNMKVVSSVEDLKAEPEETPSNVSEEKQASLFNYQLDSFTRSFAPAFAKAFATIAAREKRIGEREYKNSSEFDLQVRKVLGTHQTYVRSSIEALTEAFSSHLVCLAGIYSQRSQPLKTSFLPDYINDYVGRRFDEIWALKGDEELLSAWTEGIKRTNLAFESRRLMELILDAVLKEGDSKNESAH